MKQEEINSPILSNDCLSRTGNVAMLISSSSLEKLQAHKGTAFWKSSMEG